MSRTSSRLSHLVVVIISVGNCLAASSCEFDSDVELGDRLGIDEEVVVKNGILYAAKDVQNTEGLKRGCFCDINVCVRKCCPMGQYMSNRSCVFSPKPFVIPNEMRPGLSGYQLVFGNECKHGKRRSLIDPVFEEDYFTITKTGRLRTPFDGAVYKLRDYCVDYIEQLDQIQALVCAYRNANISSSNVVGMIISMPFLLLTFVIYALLPERNLHRKCLMCYVLTLFCAYLCLAIAQIYPNDIEFDMCEALGILCYFFFTVSFLFMNVMSFDMWWTFSGLRGFSGTKKEKERKRFIAYSLYSWGIPAILVVIVASLTHSSSIPLDAWYNPGIGDGQCWFRQSGKYAELLFFHGPLAVLIMVNIVLFCLTALKIREAQKATAMLSTSDSRRHSVEKNKKRYYLFLKLMLAMGLNWSTELISSVVRWQVKDVPEDVWYITDLCNGLYGMFIFFVFVFKRSTWELLKQRYYAVMGRPNLRRSINDPLASVHSNRLQLDDSDLYKNGSHQLELNVKD